jgi:hypothetical protein
VARERNCGWKVQETSTQQIDRSHQSSLSSLSPLNDPFSARVACRAINVDLVSIFDPDLFETFELRFGLPKTEKQKFFPEKNPKKNEK